ncbi:MAG: molybdate ABC transporter permease subunit [Fibrobacterota bacterium]|nr:molybdate ABC transporter permease subunit [Fibrobacterota bacterium]
MDLQPIWLTLQLGAVTTLVLAIGAVPIAFWLSRARPILRYPVQAIINMPLVLPPTVLGFYLLLLFSPERFTGRVLEWIFGFPLAFSFSGLVIGSVIFSLPFMINPVLSGLESLPPSLTEAAYVLGKSKWETLWRVLLPNIRPSLIAGAVLSFAHTLGEFGVVLMIGGKIPGKTRTASIAVYDSVESFRYGAAHAYSALLCLISFASLLGLFLIDRKSRRAF